MQVRVLGPLELCDGAGSVAVGSAKQRVLLALLLARAGTLVPLEDIVDELWGDRPPASALSNARMYAANLRRRFGGFAEAPALVRRGTGYTLTVAPAELDLDRFRDLVLRAREAVDRRDHAGAVERFDEGVALWRGPAVADVPVGALLARWRTTVEEERLRALEDRADALLSVGAVERAATQARELLVGQPLRERAHALLVRALHQAGDAAGALAAFETARRTLADELGVAPGEDLCRLRQAILDREPARPPSGAAVAAARPAAPVPRQLPADVPAFTGRAAYLRRLDSLLPGNGTAPVAPVLISAIAGTAGVGKTALAVHWAHRMADRFPDGQFYVNLRGFEAGGSMDPAEVLRGFLDALSVPAERVPTTVEAQSALYRSLLAGRRMLILLDNARDAEQVRPLLPGSPGCLALVTSRNPLTSLVAAEGAHPVALDPLSR